MSHWRITGVDSFMYSRSLLRIKIDIFSAKSGLRALNDLSEMVPWSFGGRLATVVSPANYFFGVIYNITLGVLSHVITETRFVCGI